MLIMIIITIITNNRDVSLLIITITMLVIESGRTTSCEFNRYGFNEIWNFLESIDCRLRAKGPPEAVSRTQ